MRCCIFQPFDNGPHDKRYKDIIEPAVTNAGLEPYRVDQDNGALIPIESLHEEIKNAAACLADVSATNANVMYELGAAIAIGKPVVIICGSGSASFPFDIRHRTIIEYTRDSSSDFEKLKSQITSRLKALVEKEARIEEIVAPSGVRNTQGLNPREITIMALIMANRDEPDEGMTPSSIKRDMERAGFTNLATNLAINSLVRANFLTAEKKRHYNDYMYTEYMLTKQGEDWLHENQHALEFKLNFAPPPSQDDDGQAITDDDVPF